MINTGNSINLTNIYRVSFSISFCINLLYSSFHFANENEVLWKSIKFAIKGKDKISAFVKSQ